MARRPTTAAEILAAAPPLPLTADEWQAVVEALGLSRQEARVAELVLRDLSDKQIAAVLGIPSRKTIETYLRDRIGRKAGTKGRIQLTMRVLAVALRDSGKPLTGNPPSGFSPTVFLVPRTPL